MKNTKTNRFLNLIKNKQKVLVFTKNKKKKTIKTKQYTPPGSFIEHKKQATPKGS